MLDTTVNYQSKLGILETEIAIKFVKDTFEQKLAQKLNLTRVSAPLFVTASSGVNDYLSGSEKIVSFTPSALKEKVEIVQSLAKWKRMSLKKYQFKVDEGLYTDMNAIRMDEHLDAIHSLYVDQWDWERIISSSERNIDFLKKIVNQIYAVIYDTCSLVKAKFPVLTPHLPKSIYFIDSQELENMYPEVSPKERENFITEKYRAVFIMRIGDKLKSGTPHDSRASDYDDWHLNGDILVWNDCLKMAFELSSMGIRVDHESLLYQIEAKNEQFKLKTPYCEAILKQELPLTIGGGIGQSRLCMFMLEKMHIGEVQVSIWDEEEVKKLHQANIHLL